MFYSLKVIISPKSLPANQSSTTEQIQAAFTSNIDIIMSLNKLTQFHRYLDNHSSVYLSEILCGNGSIYCNYNKGFERVVSMTEFSSTD